MLCRDAPVWHTATLAVRRIRIRITMKEIGNNMAPRKRNLYFGFTKIVRKNTFGSNQVENTWKVLRGHPKALKSSEWLVG